MPTTTMTLSETGEGPAAWLGGLEVGSGPSPEKRAAICYGSSGGQPAARLPRDGTRGRLPWTGSRGPW